MPSGPSGSGALREAMDTVPRRSAAGHEMASGTLALLLSEVVLLPTAFLVAAYLTRRLGPSSFGVYALGSAIAAWLEWSLAALVVRSAITLSAGSGDARAAAATLLRGSAFVGIGGGILLACAAPFLARLLGEPRLGLTLALFALEVPLFLIVQVHRGFLVGTGRPSAQARAAAWRSGARLVATVALVELGFSVPGAAIAGSVGLLASLLSTSRILSPRLLLAPGLPVAALWATVAPLALLGLCMRLFDVLDLLLLKALGASVEMAGFYGAARNLSQLGGIFSLAFSPMLLATLARQISVGDEAGARQNARNGMRLVAILLPFAAIAAGSAPEMMRFVYGRPFEAAGPVLAVLVLGVVGMCGVSITTSVLAAAGRPGLGLALVAPVLPLALAGHLIAIPRLGALGAALVTSTLAWAATFVSALAVGRRYRAWPSAGTLVRCGLLAAAAYALARAWPTTGALLVVKLLVLSGLVAVGLWLTGEIAESEVRFARSFLAPTPPSPPG